MKRALAILLAELADALAVLAMWWPLLMGCAEMLLFWDDTFLWLSVPVQLAWLWALERWAEGRDP